MKKISVLFIFTLMVAISLSYATDWYVRPAGGNYGGENGTSYANAWDGLKNVVWGAGGVQPGDTLYICGLHLFEWRSGSSGQSREIQMIGGSSGSARIRIRGDYPGDAGVIWGGALLKHESWVYEGNNTYSITCPATQNSQVWYFEDVTATFHKVLNKASSLTDCRNTPGTQYSSDYKNPSKLYVHCSDNGDPTNRITENTLGWMFNMRDLSYINWENLKCYIPKVLFTYNAPTNFASHITWKGCTIWYGDANLQLFRQGCNYNRWDGCDLAWARNGLAFAEYPVGDGTTSPHHITVKNCTIHDIGVKVHDGDAHAISFQGGHDNLVEGNDCYNCGETICFYSYPNQRIWSNTVRYNYIHDNHNSGGLCPGRGICFNIGSGRPLNDNNKIYGNIVANLVDGGIKASWSYLTEIYNNVVYNCFFSYRLSNTHYEIDILFKNNISMYPRSQHLIVQTAANEGNYVFESENNIYYPISGDQFTFDDGDQNPFVTNFAGWQTISKSGCIFDQNSLTVNPRLTNGSGSFSSDNDFRLQSNSLAIESGVDVGITQDYFGTSVPQGFNPDIGANEYNGGSYPLIATSGASPTSGVVPLSVNFTGSASGGTSPYTYSWNFGDGGSSDVQNPSHTYTSAGTYTASLTVTDNDSNQDTDTVIISVSNQANPLTASASASPMSGTAPLSVNFSGSASGGTSPYTYSWNFGDGGSSSARNPSHTYSSTGTYIAILTVTDSNSNQATDSLTINVSSSAGTQQLSLSSITGSPAPGVGGTTDPPPGSHNYASGSNVSVNALANTDYRFSEWKGDVNVSNTFDQQITVNLNTDKDLSAYFCTRCGDVNGDLMVTASDAQGAFDIFLSRNSSPTNCETENADVSCDSIVTPGDAQAIFNKFIMKGELPADCSGKTRAQQALTHSIQAAKIPEIHLIVEDTEVNSDGYVYVPIVIDNPSNIDAFGFVLQFPSDDMEFVTFDVTELLGEFYQVDAHHAEEGLLRVGGYSSTPLLNDSPEVLITLVFRVNGEATGPLSLVITNTYDDIKEAAVKDGTVINTAQLERDPVGSSERERIKKRLERLPTLLFIRF